MSCEISVFPMNIENSKSLQQDKEILSAKKQGGKMPPDFLSAT